MMHIHLHNLRFRSFHGLYEEEQLLGNEYEVNLDVSFTPFEFPVKKIGDSIDYTALYQLIKKRMAIPTALLETIVSEIVAEIQANYPIVSKISISVKKLYPPVNNFEGAVGVSFEWNK
jgi:7,8-dihydroneopterin aldolase/epimerase/oxygenase